jgi:PiT family inorganic phosphate transporter
MDAHFLIQTLTLIAGFYMAWNIGANDVANAMGTSVGSKALTLGRAVVLAALFEFAGACLAGERVTATIQKGIVSPAAFSLDPMWFAIGMLAALGATGALLHLASYWGLPISTTHAVVGGVLGSGLVVAGPGAVNWGALAQIALSWVISPCLSGVVSFGLYRAIRLFVLQPALAVTGGGGEESPLEPLFIPLQVSSACLVAFSHGANDVSNAIGPVASVFQTFSTAAVHQEAAIPLWLLALGGAGIVLGLATWGWRVIETVGKKITALSPSRGFAAEAGAAMTIFCASLLGLPISTTHALIGALLGVGLAHGGVGAVQWRTLREVLLSWVGTLPATALLSGCLCTIIRLLYTASQ